MATDTRNIFLSEKKKQFKNEEKFYEHGSEVVIKNKVVEDKKHNITTVIKLEAISKGGLYHSHWNREKKTGYGYEVLTTGYILTFSVEDGENETMIEKVEYFSDEQMLEAFERVTKYCQMAEA